ncbi:MAG TPA: hypothetical protein VN915_17130 [Elusimicrobiota bacterium]|nr:hypothetical protein [Elusimicrobiota bacterium]
MIQLKTIRGSAPTATLSQETTTLRFGEILPYAAHRKPIRIPPMI